MWSDRPLVVLDTETTGVDPQADRVVELGVAVLDWPHGSVRVRQHVRRVNPGVPIPEQASAVHGICDADVAGAPAFNEIADGFLDFLQSLNARLVGYNALAFDLPLLQAELARCGRSGRLDGAHLLDVLCFVRWHLRHLRVRKLGDLCARFEVPLRGAHNAGADARATGLLLLQLVSAGIVPDDPEAAIAEQARIVPLLDEEWRRYAYWLYLSRDGGGQLVVGAGKHCGVPLSKVDRNYCRWLVSQHRENSLKLSDEAFRVFDLRANGAVVDDA